MKKIGIIVAAVAVCAIATTAAVKSNFFKSDAASTASIASTGMYTNLYDKADSEFKNVIYVSANGSSSASGTSSSPLSLQAAIDKAASIDGATILLQSGTYKFSSVITIGTDNCGKSSAYKVLKACKGANVILDFSGESYNTSDTSVNERGIQMNGNYWYIEGIKITKAADNGMMLSGSHNVIENCVFDSNRDTGLQVSRRAASVTDYADWPSYNTIINCTSKNNCDPASFENADGFASKLTCGDGNIFDGCIAHNNSDDGWDLYAKTATGPIGVVTIRNCIAMRNGETEDGTSESSCDGNGFKLGGSGVGTPHVVTNCIAIENLHHGFTDNNNPSALQITYCTAFDNNQGGSKNNFSLYRCKDAYAANCISYTTNNASDKYVNLSGEYLVFSNSSKWYQVTNKQAVDTGSSSSRGTAISTGTKSSDFVSTSVPSVGTDFHAKWRNANGTINTNGVAIISSSSQFGKFSTDGGVIGSRLNSGSATKLTVNVATDGSINPTTTEPATTKPATTKPATTKPATTKPATTEPATTEPATTEPASTDATVHNFTKDGKTSSFFSITGNLSSSKGTVTYNGLKLTQCLKIESSTKITFTTKASSTLTLVCDSKTSKIKVDGTAKSLSNGILSISLSAGSHTLTKSSTGNLYYMSIAY